jgi:peptidoglycan/xylan/chitin deacetylase (PgdA/CDA1 family)
MISRAVAKVVRTLRAGAYALSVEGPVYRRNGSRKTIVMYHGIDLYNRTEFNCRFCSVDDFTRQVDYLRRNFTVVPLHEVFDVGASREDLLAITFDDGYRNNFKYALPILDAKRISATFFVTGIRQTGNDMLWADAIDIGSRFFRGTFAFRGMVFKKTAEGKLFSFDSNLYLNRFVKALPFEEKMLVVRKLLAEVGFDVRRDRSLEDYWMLMDEREISEASQSRYVEIGSHSKCHNNLGTISLTDAVGEMQESKSYLEAIVGKPVTSLAFPDGSYTRPLIDAAAALGYRYQLAVEYLYPEDRLDPRIMDRVGVYSDRSCVEQLHQVNSYASGRAGR